MHIEGPPRVDRPAPDYGDVVAHLGEWFAARIDRAAELGVDPEQIALDPGLDFDLTTDDDLAILGGLGDLRRLGRPLFVALSRKDFLGAVAAGSWEDRLDSGERLPATLAATALAVADGAEMLRLHDVEALDAMRTAAAIAGDG
jgi:dihydropteroate synthase